MYLDVFTPSVTPTHHPQNTITDSMFLWGNKVYKILHNPPSGTYFPLNAINCANIYNNMITATLETVIEGARRNIRYQQGVDRDGRFFQESRIFFEQIKSH